MFDKCERSTYPWGGGGAMPGWKAGCSPMGGGMGCMEAHGRIPGACTAGRCIAFMASVVSDLSPPAQAIKTRPWPPGWLTGAELRARGDQWGNGVPNP